MRAITTVVGYRPQATQSITRGVARFLRQCGHGVIAEMPLANGRRVDLMALTPLGHLLAVEVKSSLEDFRVDQKWGEYRPYCDAFAFAVNPDFPDEILPGSAGLILADGYAGHWVRDPEPHPLAPARRKALVFQFARLAAGRLQALEDPFGL
jgi:hypothetical protein